MGHPERDDVVPAGTTKGPSLSRRRFVQMVSAGLGSAAMLSLLNACGGGDEAPAPTTGGATATATSGSAGGATTPQAGGSPAATSSTSGGTPKTGGQAHVLWRSPITLNPLFSTSGSEQQVERLMFGALVKMNDLLEPVPDMAEKIDVSADATAYTFTLRENITFTDGEPLTTDDVKFTLERAIDKRTGSYWRGRLSKIAGSQEYSEQQADSVSGIVLQDERTVTINLAEADAAFLVTLCNFSGLGILPEHVLKDVAPDQLQQHPFSLNPDVTAGAFKFVRYETDQYLELARNETYWGSPPPLDSIFLQILQPDVALAQLETGQIDLMTLAVQDMERVQSLPNAELLAVPSPSMDFLAINMERDFLQDKRIRQAMMYAIDRAGILEQIYGGQGEITNSPIFGPAWMGVPEGLNEYPYDPDKAKQLLEEAGWDSGRTFEILHTPQVNKERDTAIQIIQNQWSQVGLNANIVQVDAAESNRRTIQATDFDVRTVGGGVFRADPGVSGTYMTTSTWTPNGGNYGHYSNEEIDRLYAEAQAAPEPEERKRIYTEIAKILNDELPWIFLYSPNSLYGKSKRLQGFQPPSYIDNKLWNAETWWIE